MSNNEFEKIIDLHIRQTEIINRQTDLINILLDHKIRQIDENRKFSRKLDELYEKLYNLTN